MSVFDLEASVASQRARINHRLMAKCWQDVDRYRYLLRRLRPLAVVETGTYEGYSAAWFRGQVPLVVTIDIANPSSWHTPDRGLYVLSGHSTDQAVTDEVHRIVGGLVPVVVSLDSDHNGEHVLAEMQAYAPLVRPGGYMVVEDTIIHWLDEYSQRYPIDPWDAVEMFLANHDNWEVDRELEALYPVTQFPGGWLRRTA